jgi:DNA repair protein RecN (Recombination protein N)
VGGAVFAGNRMNLCLAKSKWAVDNVWLRTKVTRKVEFRTERVGKHSFEVLHRLNGGINRYCGTRSSLKSPKVVKPHDVVRMGMRIEDRIDTLYMLPQRLNSKFRAGIDNPRAVLGLHKNGGPRPVVPRVFGPAHIATAANHGYTHRSSRTQKCNCQHLLKKISAPLHNRSVPATLRLLRIRNLALVESLDWELSSGFSVVTGETGTGKSVILGALKLILGERADKSLIRTGADQCTVEAVFALDEGADIDRLLDEQGVNQCDEGQLLIKRTLSASGSARQFINGSLTTLAVLKQVGDGLVDLHGPHDHQSLLSTEHQLALIDAFVGHRQLIDKYRESFRAVHELRKSQAELLAQTTDQNLDLWRHQLKELEAADIKTGEIQTLQARYTVGANSRRLLEAANAALQQLCGAEDSIFNQLTEIARQLREIVRLDPSATELTSAHESAAVELEELERSIRDYESRVEIDPEELRQLESRLNLLQSLQRKHQRDEEGLLVLMNELRGRLDQIGRRDEIIAEIEIRLNRETAILAGLGAELTRSRKLTAESLSKSILVHLKDLGFNRATFNIQFNPLDEPRGTGCETVEFLFAANVGEPLKPLRAVASSGEISRVMLAVKTVLAKQDLVGLLVFDEIDANVGGEIALSIGAQMHSLGQSHQIVAITHMPQVASKANRHFTVTKMVSGGRTKTLLFEVQGESRVEEIARMLGGKTKSALEHARELLKQNKPQAQEMNL